MLNRSSTATRLVALIILSYLTSDVQSVTVKGRLRNYSIKTKCLRPVGQNNGDGLEIVDCSDSADQIIEANGFKNLETEPGYIQFDVGTKCLSLNGFSSDNEVRVLIWDCVDQDNQKWKVVNGNAGGSFELQLKSTGKCLTAESGGTYLDQYECYGIDGAPHQYWTLDLINNVSPTPQPGGDVKALLRSFAHNTKCLHAKGDGNGAELELVDCSSANVDQLIKMASFQNIQNEAAYVQFDVSGKCLSLNGFSSDNEVRVLIWDCVDQDNQKWKVINGDTAGSFELQLKSSGKCLTAESGGTYLDQYECYGIGSAPHQYWTLNVINGNTPPPPQPGAANRGLLRNYAHNTKCLRAKGDGNGAELEVVDCASSSADQLIRMDSFQNIQNEAAYVRFDVNGKCLSLNGISNDNEVRVLIWDCVDQDNQKWKVINGNTGGTFELQLQSSGKCLTAEAGGTYLDQYECYGIGSAPHQFWTIDPIAGGGTNTGGDDTIDVAPYPFYQLESYNSPNKCLRYKDGSGSNYALELAACDPEDPSQRMLPFTSYHDHQLGYSGIQFISTSKCLDVSGASNSNGASVGQHGCIDQSNQRWRMENFDFNDNTFRLRTELGDKCLTSEGGGTYMDIWDCYGKSSAPHQYWKQRNPNARTLGGPKLRVLQNYNSPDKCLHPIGTSSENGVELELIDCNAIKAVESMNTDEWLNYDTAPGYVKFNNKCLSMNGMGSDNGVRLIQWDCVGQANQRWQIVNGNIDSNFQLKSEQSGKCLTAEGGGTFMDQWDCLGRDAAPHQSWMIKTIGSGANEFDEEETMDTENFFEPDGALIEVVENPGKCLRIDSDSNEVVLADCSQYDENQLFDHSDLLNYNTNPGLLKTLNNGKCLKANSDGHVKVVDCDITDLNELWFVVLGTLLGSFKLKASQSTNCLSSADDGTYTGTTDCFPTSDSRKKRDLSSRALLRMSYKMSTPNGNRLYLIRSAFYYGYCLTSDGASSWSNSKLGISDCDQTSDKQRWHFEQTGPTFQNKFYVRNGAKCLRVNGNAVGNLVDYQTDCQQSNEYVFKFVAYGSQNSYYSLQNIASGLCINLKWYNDNPDGSSGNFIDYIEQQPCNQVGTSAWLSNPIYDVEDWKCGPLHGGKFCTGKYKGMCCSKNGGCGETNDYCGKLSCDSRYGPCIKSLKDMPNLDMRCGPFIAEYANRRGTCQGIYTGSGYCCSRYGVCGNTPEYCLAENCDSEYGDCPQYAENLHPDKCGILWGNKRCSGANDEQCCSKAENRVEMGTCGAGPYHCRGPYCDAEHGACPAANWCGWLNNKKRLCPAGECCSMQNECGTSEKYCGANCNAQIAPPRGGLTTKSVGFYPESYGTCITTSDSLENEPCTIRERCQSGLVCATDPSNPRTKKCVRQ